MHCGRDMNVSNLKVKRSKFKVAVMLPLHLVLKTALVSAMDLGSFHWGLTMTTANRDDRLGEIYPKMLNDLNWHLAFFSRFHCCDRHGIGPFH